MSGPSPKIVRVISELSIAQLRDDSSNLSVGLSDNRVQAILNSHEALRQHLTESEARLASQGEQIAQLTNELAWIDSVLARRPALDYSPTRASKVELACSIAGKVDPRGELAHLQAELATALTARDEAEQRLKTIDKIAKAERIEEALSSGNLTNVQRVLRLTEAVASLRLDALLARRWKLIESAPKDGTHILAGRLGSPSPPTVVHWWPGSEDDPAATVGWYLSVNYDEGFGVYQDEPTHWAPVPRFDVHTSDPSADPPKGAQE